MQRKNMPKARYGLIFAVDFYSKIGNLTIPLPPNNGNITYESGSCPAQVFFVASDNVTTSRMRSRAAPAMGRH